MDNMAKDTAYCARHGWVHIIGEAEFVPGKFVPICELCYRERDI